MLKKYSLFLIIFFFLLTAGFGCKGLTSEQQAAVKPITLNYWTVFNDVLTLNEFAAEYKKIRPYVTVNVRQVRQGEFDNLFVNALADDVGPDIASIHIYDLGKYQNRLAVMPPAVTVANIYVKGEYVKETIVEQSIEAMPSLSNIQRDFVSAVQGDIIMDGGVYGLPLAFDTLAIYYNRDLLDKAGIPEPPATWDEFLDAVKKTTKFNKDGDIIQSGVAMGVGNNISNAFDILSLLMLQNRVTMAQGKTITFAAGLNRGAANHPTLQALRFYTDFAQPTKDVYSWNEDLDDALTEFLLGKSVFYLGFAYDRARIRSRAPWMNLEVISAPQLNESAPVNVANYWVESVVKKSENQNEAWDFIRFITTDNNIKRYTDRTGQPSPLRSQIADQAESPILGPFASQALTAQNWYHGKDIASAKKAFADLAHAHLQPYGANENPLERDARLVDWAAQVIQQTM
ncbi:MAG: extracellular solute-binding protein [Patescibacteria group bacterium]